MPQGDFNLISPRIISEVSENEEMTARTARNDQKALSIKQQHSKS